MALVPRRVSFRETEAEVKEFEVLKVVIQQPGKKKRSSKAEENFSFECDDDRVEREKQRNLSKHSHTLLALGRAAELRASLLEPEPTLRLQLPNVAPPPPRRVHNRPAPRARIPPVVDNRSSNVSPMAQSEGVTSINVPVASSSLPFIAGSDASELHPSGFRLLAEGQRCGNEGIGTSSSCSKQLDLGEQEQVRSPLPEPTSVSASAVPGEEHQLPLRPVPPSSQKRDELAVRRKHFSMPNASATLDSASSDEQAAGEHSVVNTAFHQHCMEPPSSSVEELTGALLK
eukprot:TRINITY_DN75154_c0_g1_i1.p1 TRINITY_DN75154_c0_g1~~TRINITY_DN75154_c0_g1_i1.p1  ORF type:complete len:287 (+),score=46.77 TRINITY_DN75154_c0_g1_i1:91-951(+)